MRRQTFFKLSATLVGILLLVGVVGLNSAQAFIAYDVPTGTGNQTWTGNLGMDFDVNQPIVVEALGIYDSGQDGISGILNATIFNRVNQQTVTSTLSFTGTQGTLINGSRFQNLTTPVTLAPGSYSIVSWGYSSNDPNANTHGGPGTSTLNTGGGLISFVGSARYDYVGGGVYPTFVDGGPVNRYYAGTFDFVPLPPTALLLGSGLLGLGLLRFRKRA
jgi:hypothetical protein